MSGDDDLILEDLVRIDAGTYEAVVISTRKVRRFGLVTIEFLFRIISPGSAFDVQLRGYCNLGPRESSRIGLHSKLARWMRLIATFSGISPSRVTRKSFREYWLRVSVDTVTKDYRQRSLALHDQYSTVTELLEVVGMLGEVSREQKLMSGRDVETS